MGLSIMQYFSIIWNKISCYTNIVRKKKMKMDLSATPLFRGLRNEDLPAVLQCLQAKERKYKKGEIILCEGQPTKKIGVILEGRAMVSLNDVWGNHSVLESVGPGEAFAEVYACIPGEPLMVTVSAAENSTVLFLQAGRVLAAYEGGCAFQARLIRNWLTLCAQKNLQLARRSLHTGSKSIRGRLLSYFSECAKRAGSDSFTVPYNRQQLADYLGVNRSALCSELSKMRQEGLVDWNKNRFVITRPNYT